MSEYIKDFWDSQVENHGASHWTSWGDNWMIDLEIETISSYIENGDSVIDIGCGNGYSTFRQHEKKKLSSIVGIDYAENMIEVANAIRLKNARNENIKFLVGDIRDLQFSENTFDVAYTTRVLINLPTWDEQQKGILESLRVVKPGGKLILSEGFWEPLALLNAMRALKALPPLVEHDFNRYLKMTSVESFLKSAGLSFEVNDYSSIYYLGSRFLRELVTDPSQYEGFSNPINKIFYAIEREFSGGGFGIQQAIVITK